MPRQSKAMAVLDEREADLMVKRAQQAAELSATNAELALLTTLRKAMQALPKRQSRAKPRAVVPASGNAETKATVA